jgi:long-chain acyl-CoA synthetase
MADNVVSLFHERVAKDPDRDALKVKRDGEWHGITWREYAEGVRRAANGLLAIGLSPGDRVSLISLNRPEWHEADLAIMSLGGITVPIYVTNSPQQLAYIAGHSDSRAILVENAGQLEKVIKTRTELPALTKVIVFDPAGVKLDDFVMSWEQLLSNGFKYGSDKPKAYEEAIAALKPEDLATLVYTSGTTGPPKGAMLTHANIVWTCGALNKVLTVSPDERKLSYLPLSHIAERMVGHFTHLYGGGETWFAQSIDTLREDLQACKPTIFFGVPRVWEKFHAGIVALLESLPEEQRDMAQQALQLGLKRVEAQQAGTSLPPELEEKYQEADGKLFALARGALGLDKAWGLVSGAAPINAEVLRFFHAIGLPVAEVYGQTEDNGPTSINPPDRIKIGTVGPPIPGVEVKIAEDGEVLVRGGNVGPGYYKNDEATRELIDAEGFMHSGDIGEFDSDGYLRITDRKKDLIITAAGKNIAPQVLENMLKYSPWISQVVIIGDRRPFLTALITLDQEKVTQFAEQKSIPFSDFAELSRHPDIRQLIEIAVAETNEQLARVEQIKKWIVLERDFLQEHDEMTPTMKVRRKAITEKYADTIEGMYS